MVFVMILGYDSPNVIDITVQWIFWRKKMKYDRLEVGAGAVRPTGVLTNGQS